MFGKSPGCRGKWLQISSQVAGPASTKTAPIETDVNQSGIIPALVKGLAVVENKGPHFIPDPVGHPR